MGHTYYANPLGECTDVLHLDITTPADIPGEKVCAVGETEYETLAEALANAGAAATIKLLKSFTVVQSVVIKNQDITFDLNSYTLTIVTTADEGLKVTDGSVDLTGAGALNVTGKINGVRAVNSHVTVTNATASDTDTSGTASGIGVYATGGSEVTVLEDAAGAAHGVKAENTNTIVTVNGDVSNSAQVHGAVYSADQAEVIVNGNVTSSQGYGVHAVGGKIIVDGNVSASQGAMAENMDSHIYIKGDLAGYSNGAIITSGDGFIIIDGEISASLSYVLIGMVGLTQESGVDDPAKPGYLKYSDNSQGITGAVWVKKPLPPADITPPAFMTGYPKPGAMQANGSKRIAVMLKFSEDANYYCVLMPAGSTAPTVQQIIDHWNLVASIPGVITIGGGLSAGGYEFTDFYGPEGLDDATSYDLYFVLKDQAGNLSSVEKLTLSTPAAVPLPPLILNGGGLNAATQGVPYEFQFSTLAAGGTGQYTWQISSGSVPPGLTLNTATGYLSGTPTAAGDYSFTITVTDNKTPIPNTATASYTLRVNEPILVSSITVDASGGVSSVKKGQTLQMIASVLPANAADKTVTWSVINGTGSATISSGGLLTATAVGTVTVKATANDGSAVEGVMTITITSSTSSGGGGGSVNPSTSKGEPVSSEGGTIKDSGITIDFPEDAVNGTIKVVIARVSSSSVYVPGSMELISDVFDITKDKSGNFDHAVTITLPFDTDLADEDTDMVAIYWWDGKTWVILDNIKVDWGKGTVSGDIDHFTKFAVLATAKTAKPEKEEPAKPDTPKPDVILNDIAGHWAEKAIREMVGTGAINGYPDGTFRPDQPISRAEFATVLVKSLGLPVNNSKNFADTSDHWAREAISTAYAAGVISGYDDRSFGPDDPITREQIAVMINKAFHLSQASSDSSFADSKNISVWAREAVAAAYASQLISGYPDNTFKPQNQASRAEAAAILTRAQR